MNGPLSIPRDITDPADEAIATLLDARTDPYAWAQLRHDTTMIAALRTLHLVTFPPKLADARAAHPARAVS